MANVAIAQPRETRAVWRDLPAPLQRRVRIAAAYVVLLALLFVRPLAALMQYAAGSNLHSHILLVPLVTGYLIWIQGSRLLAALAAGYRRSTVGTVMLLVLGAGALAVALTSGQSLSVNDHLALMAFAFVSFVAAGGFLCLGSQWMAAAAFPVEFLVFMVPLPDAAVNALERASMLASAEATAIFFNVTGTSYIRHDTVFELPGIALRVAQECSGIHSSWVLVITSLLASHMFLRSQWRRLVLVLFVIPLGIVRNGFRILVIGLLCVNVGPHMIDSPIHRRGGPLFFALSLVPLFLLLWWLRHQEQRATLRG